jgi:hypothetical protein
MSSTDYIVSIKKGSKYNDVTWQCFLVEFEKLLNQYDLVGFIENGENGKNE